MDEYVISALGERTYYMAASTNIGVYRYEDDTVAVIDTGIDAMAGQAIAEAIVREGWRIGCIILTHYHADHCGGCAYLQSRFGCPIYATPTTVAVLEHPLLNPSLIYGGLPLAKMMNRFYYIEPAHAISIYDVTLPEGLSVVPLDGHAFEMIGILTEDGVLFSADAYVGESDLVESPFTYVYDVGGYLASMRALSGSTARMTVGSHTTPSEDVTSVVEYNIKVVENNMATILNALDKALTLDELAAKLISGYARKSITRYTLLLSVLRNYLSYMETTGVVTPAVVDGSLRYIGN